MARSTDSAPALDVAWRAPLFRGLDERGKADLAGQSRIRRLAAGERVFRPGEPADAFFAVISGTVAVAAERRGDTETTVIRRAGSAEIFGEEGALFVGRARTSEAYAEDAAEVLEVPLLAFERAITRAGGSQLWSRLERTIRRRATEAVLSTMSFARHVSERDRERLLDAAETTPLARGEPLYRTGDPATALYFVLDGMLQVQSEDDEGRPRIEAYLSRGDVVGEGEPGEVRVTSVLASGPSWVARIPDTTARAVLGKVPGLFERLRRVSMEGAELQRKLVRNAGTTAHAFKDLYRLTVAKSLLVIDQDACVRCGHCAYACASVHEDGVSRLVRRGDKIAVATEGGRSTLLLPNSCQHCKNPTCMVDCPTGAIGRDARGEVFIKEDLCTGCGNCAKGCPWDNIQIAPRVQRRTEAAPSAPRFADVAVKCDLCRGVASGPACVSACPTAALSRVEPSSAFAELGGKGAAAPLDGGRTRARIAMAGWMAGAAIAAVGLARAPWTRWQSGIALLVLMGWLAAYLAKKRVLVRGPNRPHLVAHLVTGLTVPGALLCHVGRGMPAPANAAGALVIATLGALASGALVLAAYALLPRSLTRVEERGVLPEDIGPRLREIEGLSFSRLTGRSELTKKIYATILDPYRRSFASPLLLVFSARTASDARAAIHRRIGTILAGRGKDKLQGVDELVRLTVEHVSLRAHRVLLLAIRGVLVPHVLLSLAALAILVVHVALAVGHR